MIMVNVPDRKLPVFERAVCDECDEVVWVKHTRVQPETWTDEDFHKAYEIHGKQITERANDEN
jgi:hypothetical protein